MVGLTSGALFGRSLVRRSLVQYLEKPLTGLFLTAGLIITANSQVLADSNTASAEFPNIHPNIQMTGFLDSEISNASIADGIYLYGQSADRDQIGSAYMVFQVEQGQVEGAFYMPRSSFDCFYGNFQTDHLALTVINSYEQTHYPYAIALESQGAVATIDNEAVAPVGLQGFHRLENPNESDLRILSTCQAGD